MNEQQFWGMVQDFQQAGFSRKNAIALAWRELGCDEILDIEDHGHAWKLPSLDYYDRLVY